MILNPILLKLDNVNVEKELSKIFETSKVEIPKKIDIEDSFEILNNISKNLSEEVEQDVREIEK